MISDIIGITGRVMLEAPIASETHPSNGRSRSLHQGAAGSIYARRCAAGSEAHHRFLLRLHLQQFDALDTAIGEIDREADERIHLFRTQSSC